MDAIIQHLETLKRTLSREGNPEPEASGAAVELLGIFLADVHRIAFELQRIGNLIGTMRP